MRLMYTLVMRREATNPIVIVNKLQSATIEGKLLWERTGDYGTQYKVVLDEDHIVTAPKVPAGNAVVLTITNAEGKPLLHLDSGRVDDDVLKLALLQLYVTVRDAVAALLVEEAAKASEDL